MVPGREEGKGGEKLGWIIQRMESIDLWGGKVLRTWSRESGVKQEQKICRNRKYAGTR